MERPGRRSEELLLTDLGRFPAEETEWRGNLFLAIHRREPSHGFGQQEPRP